MSSVFQDIYESSHTRRRTWAEIDLDIGIHNYEIVRAAAKSKLCCVIKANAYGHGAVELAKLYARIGADFLAVSNVEEALQIRSAGVSLPILILGYTPAACAALLAKHDLSQCVYSRAYGDALAQAAEKAGVAVKIHLKIDTGMGRIGFAFRGDDHDELADALAVCAHPSLIREGIFTHFAVADEGEKGEAYTRKQFALFTHAVETLAQHGATFAIRHCANSAAIFAYPEYHLDMVRAGVVLYGLAPSASVKIPSLKPMMTLKTVVSHVKTVYPGESVSYGRRYTASGETRVATVPIGYADGFFRTNSCGAYALLIGGKRAPILGSVCMDQTMLDASNVNCKLDDEVTVFGAEDGNTAADLARACGTIPYEIVCAVGERVPRAYLQNGRVAAWTDNIWNNE
ncbi:MAG: alanine racemase [Oscillospiraceae bacterium]|nr:alanine racemase [Oscillospiraceae bacterium]